MNEINFPSGDFVKSIVRSYRRRWKPNSPTVRKKQHQTDYVKRSTNFRTWLQCIWDEYFIIALSCMEHEVTVRAIVGWWKQLSILNKFCFADNERPRPKLFTVTIAEYSRTMHLKETPCTLRGWHSLSLWLLMYSWPFCSLRWIET